MLATAFLLKKLCAFTVGAAALAPVIDGASTTQRLPPSVVASLIRQESSCRVDARGAAGELGLMQIKRGTFATAGYEHFSDAELMEPTRNIMLGTRHLRRCLNACDGNLEGALSKYKGIKGCVSSKYSTAILARVERSRRVPVVTPQHFMMDAVAILRNEE